ncbi:UDP-2,4-diacetamido-2,4,6-trideoxy-beta-L-altropyranose hydrolase [Rhizobium tumorigenes]
MRPPCERRRGVQKRSFRGMNRSSILFRVDASSSIGSGHVMRCLSLANVLKLYGYECVFAARFMPEGLEKLVAAAGHKLERLDCGYTYITHEPPVLDHADWLGSDQRADADQCIRLSGTLRWDWIVVDHYALDVRWEERVRPICDCLMVIDDLGDRRHDCDLLLDQNLGSDLRKYDGKVPASCRLLLGPRFALLRPEFAQMRQYSLARRKKPQLNSLLITMGGADNNNVTSDILNALKKSPLPLDCRITVVMGSQSRWFSDVGCLARTMPWLTSVHINVPDMARLMAESDLAIGAAGGTAWERCCLALPSLIVIIADNQRQGALALSLSKAAVVLNPTGREALDESLPTTLSRLVEEGLASMIENLDALNIEGSGTEQVALQFENARSPGDAPRLRLIEEADLPVILTWRNDTRVRKYMFSQEIISLHDHVSWYERVKNDPLKRLLIFETAAQPRGFVNFKIDATGVGASWGFYKGPEMAKGTGYLMGRAALAHGFEQLGLQTISAEVLEGNHVSARLHKALGFRQGALKLDAYEINGSYVNVVCFTLSKTDWLTTTRDC